MKWILTDIEGTTSSIDFVHKVLFPFSLEEMGTFLRDHWSAPTTRPLLERMWIEDLHRDPTAPLDRAQIQATLEGWIKEDRKNPVLKKLQGMIWKQGYETNSFVSHIYPDVVPQLKAWKARGYEIAIYSSGSVEAQKLFFKYTSEGNLLNIFSCFFDTDVGPKRDTSSYATIATLLNASTSSILFLSDIAEELDAAEKAGLKTCQIIRGAQPSHQWQPNAPDFYKVDQLLG